jgi:hypothetical protein
MAASDTHFEMNKGAKAPVQKISKDIFIEETIIRADKYYHISDAFTFTPTMEKSRPFLSNYVME